MVFSLVVLLFIFIIGLVTGSFLNVVILRTVSGESIVFPGSKCPKCQTPLKWYHNIPVFSYIFLKGKCGFCHEKISIQYPIVELLTGIIFILMFLRFCNPFDEFFGLDIMNPITYFQIINYIFGLIVSCLFIIIAGTDILEMRVSDKHTYSLIGCGILYSIIMASWNLIAYKNDFGLPKMDFHFIMTCPILYSIAGAVICFIFMEIVRKVSAFILKKEALGDGDSYIMAGIGSVFGAILGNSSYYIHFDKILLVLLGILLLSGVLSIIFILPLFVKKLIEQNNKLLLGGLATFIIYAIAFIFAKEYGWLNNVIALYSSSIVLIIFGLFLCRELLNNIKNNHSDGIPFPFGPALVGAALIALLIVPL